MHSISQRQYLLMSITTPDCSRRNISDLHRTTIPRHRYRYQYQTFTLSNQNFLQFHHQYIHITKKKPILRPMFPILLPCRASANQRPPKTSDLSRVARRPRFTSAQNHFRPKSCTRLNKRLCDVCLSPLPDVYRCDRWLAACGKGFGILGGSAEVRLDTMSRGREGWVWFGSACCVCIDRLRV